MREKTILIVDDEPVWVKLLCRLFKHYGCTVVSACSCSEGLEVLRLNRVDCAILDFNLVDGSGAVICAAIRVRDCGIKTPVIIFTFDQGAESCLSGPLGADIVVSKDKPLSELYSLVANFFKAGR
jgi:CheY-like chemotaxis protein